MGERSERVRHVYVHAGGKIEALGTGQWAASREESDEVDLAGTSMVTVETVCVVDVRDNTTEPEPDFGEKPLLTQKNTTSSKSLLQETTNSQSNPGLKSVSK